MATSKTYITGMMPIVSKHRSPPSLAPVMTPRSKRSLQGGSSEVGINRKKSHRATSIRNSLNRQDEGVGAKTGTHGSSQPNRCLFLMKMEAKCHLRWDISGSSVRKHDGGGKPTKLGSRSLTTQKKCTACSHMVGGAHALQMTTSQKRVCNIHGVKFRSLVRALPSQCQSK